MDFDLLVGSIVLKYISHIFLVQKTEMKTTTSSHSGKPEFGCTNIGCTPLTV